VAHLRRSVATLFSRSTVATSLGLGVHLGGVGCGVLHSRAANRAATGVWQSTNQDIVEVRRQAGAGQQPAASAAVPPPSCSAPKCGVQLARGGARRHGGAVAACSGRDKKRVGGKRQHTLDGWPPREMLRCLRHAQHAPCGGSAMEAGAACTMWRKCHGGRQGRGGSPAPRPKMRLTVSRTVRGLGVGSSSLSYSWATAWCQQWVWQVGGQGAQCIARLVSGRRTIVTELSVATGA
jgi:hypothetical protein